MARLKPFSHWRNVLPLFCSLTTIRIGTGARWAIRRATATLSSGDASSRTMISCGLERLVEDALEPLFQILGVAVVGNDDRDFQALRAADTGSRSGGCPGTPP